MIEAIEVAYYEGKILCAFFTRDECKNFINKEYPNIDKFDVELKTQFITSSKPYVGGVPR
jgi:hypothetical protein